MKGRLRHGGRRANRGSLPKCLGPGVKRWCDVSPGDRLLDIEHVRVGRRLILRNIWRTAGCIFSAYEAVAGDQDANPQAEPKNSLAGKISEITSQIPEEFL